ncbi:FAD-dependent oxidoreductase [Paeniroseomonas aquatica]|uniref:FAD-dependent oxidoreductase n=1 Tax=Paeniroseomonas aquatica TaxID=373043 RepID=A0ABT8AFW1_9PROT|nr:FAD-dependent oxidoreductase [Paeniroseomonas aquatica]MDN3568702.1 FAD-dependent oxidoreductase [Paeniroseomonas aquatica]
MTQQLHRACDVVVVGAGCAGLATAIAAAELGLDCLVLEKAAKLGGGTAISSGYLWVGANHLHAAAGGVDSLEAVTAYLRYVGAGGLDEARMAAFIAEAPYALRFFEAAGIPFRLSPRIDHYGMAPGALAGGRILETPPIEASALGAHYDNILLPAGPLFRLGGATGKGGANSPAFWQAARDAERDRPGQRASGAGLVSWLVKLADARGVEIHTGQAVKRLTMQDGRVTGVVTANGDTIAARRGVVIASGGYESNAELVRRFEALPGWQSMFPKSISGDGLVMATEHGAAVHVIGNNLSVFLGFRNPEEAPGGTALCRLSGTQELPSPHTIVVNRHGRRFADESFFQAVAPALREFDVVAREQPNLPCWLIFDQRYVAQNSFGGRPPGAEIPPWVDRAPTLDALAARLGIAAEGLADTVRRFNADVGDGTDRQFGRGQSAWGLNRYAPSATLGPIEEAPFYGICLHPTALSSAGLLADPLARVLHVRGHPIPGLYAVGNAAARTETGSGYQTGFSLASGLTFGLVAARRLAAAGTA